MAPLQWTETAPGHYERPLDDIESLFAQVASGGASIGREHTAITAGVKIELESADLVAVVKQAWTTLRYECPSLATTTEGDKRVYQVANDAELESWLEETYIVDDSTTDAERLFSKLRPVKRATLYLLLQSKELVFRCSHDRFDGVGIIYFFDHLLQVLASPKKIGFGDEAKNLFPTLKIAANIPDATQSQVEKLKNLMNQWASSLPSIGLKIGKADQLPGATKAQRMTLSEYETANVIAAAKKRGLTPTHVAHAAVIFAAKSHGGCEESYVSTAHFNLRHRCEQSDKNTVANYYTPWLLMIVPSDFINTANQLKNFYVGFLADQDSLPMIAPFAAELKLAFSIPPPSPPSEPIISSLGIIDSRLKNTYGPIHVKDFWMTLDMLSPEVMVYVWTWQGKMTFEACYNEVFHQVASIEEFLQTMKDILFKELELE